MKVLVKTPLSPYSGYGRDGIEMLTAMMNMGWDIYLQPMAVQAPLPQHIADLLTKEHQAPFDLFIQHTDPMTLECSDEVARHADVNLAWTMWEYTGLKRVMAEKDRRTLRRRLKNFDIFVGYSDVDPIAFGPYFDGPLIVQQGGFDPAGWPEVSRDWHTDKIRFIQHGVLSQRKDPFRLIRAYSELRNEHIDFMEGTTLALHTTAPGIHSAVEDIYPGVRMFYEMWPTETVRQFYAAAHVLVSPSRGEGKDLPALEFMSTGGVVIATDFAGHKQWLDPAYSYPLRITMEPAVEDYRTDAMNARADVDHLKELMLHIFHNRAEAQEKGRLAAKVVPQAHSWDHVLENLVLKVRDSLPAEKGERFWTLAQIAYARAPREPVGARRE